MGSFLPPAVGDTVTIEAGEVSLIKLQFSGGKMIPVNKPLQKHSMPNSSDYMVYFQSVQDESNIGSSTLTVMVGKFGNGGGVDSYSATIQYIYQSKDSGLITTLDEAKLSCVAKPL